MDKNLARSPKKNETPRSFLCGTYVKPTRDTFGNNQSVARSLDFNTSSASLRCRSLEASQRLIGSVAFTPANRHRIAQEKPPHEYIDEYNLSKKKQQAEIKHTVKAVESLQGSSLRFKNANKDAKLIEAQQTEN